MRELEKKLAELEKEKEKERREKEEAERRRQEEDKKRNQENYFQRRWDDVVDDFEHPDHIADNFGKDFEDTVDTLEDDEKEIVSTVRKLPDRSRRIWRQLLALKWIVNLWLVGVPWGFALLALFGWNMYVNIFWNKWWAEGNFFLMGNTLYIIAQSIVSIPLMFEIPLVLRFMKPFRVISFFSAIAYNIMFLGSVADFFYITKAEDKNDFEDEG